VEADEFDEDAVEDHLEHSRADTAAPRVPIGPGTHLWVP
jgi:hypothetical protein